MDVELYVYDLSKGLARQFSYNLTGVQIDAIFHTSLVFGGVEFFFGQGIHRKIPGSTHHGRPIEIVRMGTTELPMDVIAEYIDSLAQIYTPESYDLFLHNCNNFTQDLSMFLVGKDIPESIRTLPQKFLETPIGQMLRGQIDQSMRSMTQAPDADMDLGNRHKAEPRNAAALSNGVRKPSSTLVSNSTNGQGHPAGHVHNVTTIQQIESLLESAKNSCSVIFFTSARCAPCKIVYPAYDELAAEAGNRAVLIKVDLSQALAVSSKYQVRSTPTFMTFLKGQRENMWSGANEAKLKDNVRLLIQMAWPLHAHASLKLPTFQHKVTDPVSFKKVPPLDKLAVKIGRLAEVEKFSSMTAYIKMRETSGQIEAPLPNLSDFSDVLASEFSALPPEVHFAVIDLLRVAATDPRISGYYATEREHRTILTLISSKTATSAMPYNLQVVTLQLACNLFTSPLLSEQLVDGPSAGVLRNTLEILASSCLLAKHSNARLLASALVYNLAMVDHNLRVEREADKVKIDTMGDLEAALIEAVISEGESKETLHGLLLALGMVLYAADVEGSTWELCRTMEVRKALREKSKMPIFAGEPLIQEVGEELLGRGDRT